MSILDRITSLRNLMSTEQIDAVLIYGTDPHLSEYVPKDWRSIEWISGFTGSYAKVAITKDKAVLWTDSRYYIQAESQLKGSGFKMIKDRQSDAISVEDWLKIELAPGTTVAVDGLTVSATAVSSLTKNLSANTITLALDKDLVSPIWTNRPILSHSQIVDYPVRWAGQSRVEKLSIIRKSLTENKADAIFITQLDDLAWSFNLRGSEINYIPVFSGYGYIDQSRAFLFVNDGRLSEKLSEILKSEGIVVHNYKSIFPVLEQVLPRVIFLDPDRTNSTLYSFFSKNCQVINGVAIPTLLKSIKNNVEIAGMRAAHRRDGVAMVNFLYWFYTHSPKSDNTELSVSEKLRKFRSEQKYFISESFSPIVAFGSHGAVVHYGATPETDLPIGPDGILLIDSGGQYLDGTTDITRTIPTGKVTLKQKYDFTIVLKAMINLAKAKFPENTKGYSLDSIARKELWDNSLNYGHGTGHGIGHFLSVHEGPMSIRSEFNAEPIRAGQILTDEPGLYREGQYGIRIENVLVCKNHTNSAFGQFLSFDTLTLCPIDKKLINRKLLSLEEVNWLNAYHRRVFSALKPYLKPEILNWLEIQCSPL